MARQVSRVSAGLLIDFILQASNEIAQRISKPAMHKEQHMHMIGHYRILH